jgi:hypothetical protein
MRGLLSTCEGFGRPEMKSMEPALDPAIKTYYDRSPEESRLELGPFQLEALRSRELILCSSRKRLLSAAAHI